MSVPGTTRRADAHSQCRLTEVKQTQCERADKCS